MSERVTASLFTGHGLRGQGPGAFVLHACPDVVAGHGLGDLVYEILSTTILEPVAAPDRIGAAR